MKWIISLLVALVIGALAGSWIKNLPGFVIIAYDKTTYEMRLWIAVCLLLMLLCSLFLIGVLFRSIVSNALKVKGWHGNRGWRRSRKQTITGMLAFTEGRWKASEDAMVSAAKSSDTKLINYLIAAQAAQQQNAEVRRDTYLRLAHQAEPAAKIAIGLTQAKLQLKQGQFEQALASLNKLSAQTPSHPYVLKLLSHSFEKLQDWNKLQALLPKLKKYQVFELEELQTLQEKCIAGRLEEYAAHSDVEGLRDCWLALPSALRKSTSSNLCYARFLIKFEQMDEAEVILKSIIKKNVSDEVLILFGSIKSKQPAKQLNFLESWQQAHSDAPKTVYLTLGKIAFNATLWGKARHFLELALTHKPSAEAYLMMAKTLQQLRETQAANQFYQQGLEFIAAPQQTQPLLTLPQGSDDLVSANLLPKFQKLE